jgi:lipoyl synthase
MAKPEWLKIKVRSGPENAAVEEILARLSLHTVCEEASCPNLMECFGRKTATFMILGRICSRNCTFCDVSKGIPQPVDGEEPAHLAQAVKELALRHVVITSVTRDDLPDGGAGHFAQTIKSIREAGSMAAIEVLIPDFKGDMEALKKVIDAEPEIINHNLETVPRLYSEVRPMAVYRRSLELLKNIKSIDKDIMTKSGIMLGLGESEDEVIQVMKDLRTVNCDLLTIGQYLAPSKNHHPVIEYVHPDIFEKHKKTGSELGFRHIASGPLVRSSYMAHMALSRPEYKL